MDNQVDEVKRKTDIVSLISEYMELKKAGRNFKGNCPFHGEKTPSFIVSPELQIYKCFGCGVGGDAFRFLIEYEKLDFPQALKILADRAGVKLKPVKGYAGFQEKEELYRLNYVVCEFYHYLLLRHTLGKAALEYLKKRGITDEALSTFKLGFAPDNPTTTFNFLTRKRGYSPQLVEKAAISSRNDRGFYDRFRGRVMFPLFDHYGNTVGFAGRILEERGEMAKYINSPETLVYKKGNLLYGLETTKTDIKKMGFAVVVEGEIDCISTWQAGIKNVVAIKGSAFTEEQADLIHRFCPKVVLALDADFAGDNASRRGLDILQKAGVEVAVANLGKYKDPDEAARDNPEYLKEAINNAESVYDFLVNSVFKRYNAQTVDGKSRISQEITPILASIDDEIVRAYCIKRVAEGLGVPEEAVQGQVNKSIRPTSIRPQARQEQGNVDRRTMLEERFLTLSLQLRPEFLVREDLPLFMKSPVTSRLVEEFQKQYKDNPKSFDPSEFSKSIPQELLDYFSQVVLADIRDVELDRAERELKDIERELEMLTIREKIHDLTAKIKQIAGADESPELMALEEELSRQGQKLSQLEQQ
jgi:DNA primase